MRFCKQEDWVSKQQLCEIAKEVFSLLKGEQATVHEIRCALSEVKKAMENIILE